MLLGFKRQFAPFVEDGSKTHTIRGARKIIPKAGDDCHCYVDPRQKTMRLLGRWPCVKVDEIYINSRILSPTATHIDIRINGVPLHWDEKSQLAWRDGFRDRGPDLALVRMMQFWEGRLPFVGHLIHWDFAHPILSRSGPGSQPQAVASRADGASAPSAFSEEE